MSMTQPQTTTAREVVAEYLKSKAESNKPAEQRERIAVATVEIVGELPDGFTYKDVRACVGEYIKGVPGYDGMTASKIGRTVTKQLNDLVADGTLAIGTNDRYEHR